MALVAYLMERKQNFGPHLIIVPNAVMVNWKAELTQWLPTVRCVYYVGNKVQCEEEEWVKSKERVKEGAPGGQSACACGTLSPSFLSAAQGGGPAMRPGGCAVPPVRPPT